MENTFEIDATLAFNTRNFKQYKEDYFTVERVFGYYTVYELPENVDYFDWEQVMSFLYRQYWDSGCFDTEWGLFEQLDRLYVNDKVDTAVSPETDKTYVYILNG